LSPLGSLTHEDIVRRATELLRWQAARQKRKVLYGKSRKEVAQKLTKAMADRDGGLVFDHENLCVEEYLQRWLKGSVRDNVKPVTYDSYTRIIRVHVIPTLGRVKLDKLNPLHLQTLYRERLNSGLSSRTVQYIHVVMHRALKQAVRWGLVPRNVSEAVDPPRTHRKEMRPLSPGQARSLLEAAQEERLEALYVVALHCGLRQGELLALRWEDVDLEARTLRISRTLSRTKDGPTFTAPKTARSRRTVRLTIGAMEALKRHSERQAQEIVRMDTLYQDQGLIFASEVGTPLNRHNVNYRSFKPLLKRAGLPNVRFHDLRHTCATLLLGRGVHPKFVQELLGHATIAVTLDTYSHVLPNMGDQVSRAMEEALSHETCENERPSGGHSRKRGEEEVHR
jgi:integrase